METKEMETKAKNIIKIEDFIMALFIKIEKVDAVDLKYLLEDFESKTNSEVSGYFDFHKLPIEVRNSLINDKETGVLEADIDYGKKIKMYFKINPTVDEYFENLDVEKLMEAKNQAYASYKERVLNEANVLLISNSEKEYQELLRFGFKNVEFFKSIVRANKYFEEHPNELNKYHIVLRGEKCDITDVGYNLSLLDKINHLNYYNHIVETYMSNEEERNRFYIYLHDYKRARTFGMRAKSYYDLYERLAENAFINDVLEVHPVDNEKFLKYSDSEVKEKMPLPKKKSDLKVLFLSYDSYLQNSGVKEYLEKLGLQLEIGVDNNNSLKNTILHHLGEYDIIIASHLYSDYILQLGIESTEQCKDTGRQFVLLVDYDIDDLYISKNISKGNFISNIELEYIFAGERAEDNEEHELQYEVVNQNLDDIDVILYAIHGNLYKNEETIADMKSSYSNKISQVVSIVEAAVTIYYRSLIKMGEEALEDFDFKTPDDYYLEAFDEYSRLTKIEDAAIEEIGKFKELMKEVWDYLYFKKEYRAPQYVEGLAISEKGKTITIQNVFNGRVLCEIVVQNYFPSSNLYSFKMRVLSEKGTLMPPQEVGVYTIYYNGKPGVPPRLNEKQLSALNATLKKVQTVLKPINQAAENDDRPLGLRKRNY